MKKILWPIIHKFKIHNNLCLIKYPWGWMPESNIIDLKYSIPKTEYNIFFPENWQERERYFSTHLNIKVKEIYSSIFNSYINNDNFIEKKNIIPKLSNALNFFNNTLIEYDIKKPNMQILNINSEILGSWVSIGNSTCNTKFLGLWDKNQINNELIAGFIGPEIKHTWDLLPIKQNVRVLFQVDNRFDIWDFERCLMIENDNWKVSNINNILV